MREPQRIPVRLTKMYDLDLEIVGRDRSIFADDTENYAARIETEVQNSRFLVIGGAGTIGQAVSKEIFARNPSCLHVVDISENNLVELVRDIRSSMGYIDGDFETFAIDCGSIELEKLLNSQRHYDYVLNLSALKHVRSEQDPYTLMRMIKVNIINTIRTIDLATKVGAKKYFCVSTDKAANPVNMMGASKRIMELFLANYSKHLPISTARFANVVFSDGSLLHGFRMRLDKKQPIVAPNDVRRYFVTPKEAGELCLLSCILGESGEVFFPKLTPELDLKSFSDIAKKFLAKQGFVVDECVSEADAREKARSEINAGKWPCLFLPSDTTGEKSFEEFYTVSERPNFDGYESLGRVKLDGIADSDRLDSFLKELVDLENQEAWQKEDFVSLFRRVLPDFNHLEVDKYLSQKM